MIETSDTVTSLPVEVRAFYMARAYPGIQHTPQLQYNLQYVVRGGAERTEP
jgi:hypothetical protein